MRNYEVTMKETEFSSKFIKCKYNLKASVEDFKVKLYNQVSSYGLLKNIFLFGIFNWRNINYDECCKFFCDNPLSIPRNLMREMFSLCDDLEILNELHAVFTMKEYVSEIKLDKKYVLFLNKYAD